jgi:Uma2 family endonuclease
MESQKRICKICGQEKESSFCSTCNRETSSHFQVVVEDNIKVHDSLKIKKFIKRVKDWVVELVSGWFSSENKKNFPEGVNKYRLIDREKGKYEEKVKNINNNQVARNIKEPLSVHISEQERKRKINI